MKKLILVNQSSGHLTIDTANAYATKFDKVILIAGKVERTERKLNESIRVDKIIAYNRTSAIKRIATWLIGFIQIFILLAFKYRKCEVVYVTNPPMSYLASLILGNPFSVIVYDTYPDALKNIGIRNGHWLYNLWSKWNIKLFRKAKRVYTLSEGMADQLANYVDKSHIKVVPLWSASDSFGPIEKSHNAFISKHSLEGKFIVLYSGNMGYTHNVESLVEVAKILRDKEQIQFVFIGSGKKKQELIDTAENKKLKNCTFLDWQPFEMLPFSLASADLGVVTLNEDTALTSVPSKTFNLLAVGAPLLCIAPEHSEISRIVNKYGNGMVCPATELTRIADFILYLAEHEESQIVMSSASLRAAKEFTKENAFMYL